MGRQVKGCLVTGWVVLGGMIVVWMDMKSESAEWVHGVWFGVKIGSGRLIRIVESVGCQLQQSVPVRLWWPSSDAGCVTSSKRD